MHRKYYESRIQELRSLGKEENIAIRPESEKDFWSFILLHEDLKKCGLTLLDGGNLSALWTKKSRYRAVVRFLGDDQVQFTFIRYDPNVHGQPSFDSVETGKCSVMEVARLLREFGFVFE